MNRILLTLVLFACVSALGATPQRAQVTLPLVSDLDTRQPITGSSVVTLGVASAGDYRMEWYWDSSDTTSPQSAVCRTNAYAAGRYKAYWDGDVRAFGATPYRPFYTHTPWGYRGTNAPIGTNEFSIWIRTKLPTLTHVPAGLFYISSTNNWATDFNSAFEFRATDSVFGFISRGTNGSSSTAGGTVDDGSTFQATAGNPYTGLAGTVVDLVVTRSTTTPTVWINGTNVSGDWSIANSAGWAKALGNGDNLLVQVGNNGNPWFWSEPVYQLRIYNRVLGASDMADLTNATGQTFAYTATETTEPEDQSTAFQAAIDYASSVGGRTVWVPDGYYRLDSEVYMKPNVTLSGVSRPSHYQGSDSMTAVKGSALIHWYGSTHNWIGLRQADGVGESLSTRSLGTWGTLGVRSMRAGIENLSFVGVMSDYGRAISADRVGAVSVRNNNFFRVPGKWLWAIAPHAFTIFENRGQTLGGLYLYGGNDSDISYNFIDGVFGPNGWLKMNTTKWLANHFEYANNPALAQTWEQEVTADAGTDLFTTATPHRFQTGDMVRFETDNTLPAPLNAAWDYWVVRASATTFRVATNYVDELLGTGAINGTYLDLTDAGTGTHTVTIGPAVGALVQGDGNTFTGNRFALNWEEGVRLEYANRNEFVGNNILQNWFDNSASTETNRPAVRVIGSTYNTFHANSIDRRISRSYANTGIFSDSTSYYQTLLGNSQDVNSLGSWTNYVLDAGAYSTVIDGLRSVFPNASTTKGLYIPASSFFPSGTDDTEDWASAARIRYDWTDKRLFVNSDNGTNYVYSPMASAWAPVLWKYNGTSGGLEGASATTGQTMVSLVGPYAAQMLTMRAESTTAGEGTRFATFRNGAASGAYGAVGSDYQLGSWLVGGWYGTGSADINGAGAELEVRTSQAWSSGTNGTYANFKLTQNDTASRSVVLQLSKPASGGGGSSVTIYDSASNALFNIKVGPTNSGPGGVGRALYID